LLVTIIVLFEFEKSITTLHETPLNW
jgi:hypothetical protein